jgi:uncharacterized protein
MATERAAEHEFTIPVMDLDAGGKSVDFPVRAAWIRSALEGTDVTQAEGGVDGALSLRLSKSGTDVVLRGTLKADLVVPCGRCLEPAKVAVRETVSALAVPKALMRESAGDDDDADLAPEQADMIPYDGETLVLDELVRDELLLGVPMIPLCSEDCAGIRPIPGAQPAEAALETETAIDPRLRPLLRLKKQLQ